jgi:hypothetical protein
MVFERPIFLLYFAARVLCQNFILRRNLVCYRTSVRPLTNHVPSRNLTSLGSGILINIIVNVPIFEEALICPWIKGQFKEYFDAALAVC